MQHNTKSERMKGDGADRSEETVFRDKKRAREDHEYPP